MPRHGVDDQVVGGQEQYGPPVAAGAAQRGPEQGGGGQVEAAAQAVGQLVQRRVGAFRGAPRQVVHLQVDPVAGGGAVLAPAPVGVPLVAQPQGVVVFEDRGERAAQQRLVSVGGQVVGDPLREARRVTGEGVEQPVLYGGQWRLAHDRALFCAGRRGGQVLGRHGQLRDRLVLEQVPGGEGQAGPAGGGDDLDAEDGVAAKGEVVVAHAHVGHAEHLGPDGGECLLGGGAWRVLPAAGVTRRPHRLGQCPAVQLPGGAERQLLQRHHHGRDQVVGQRPREEGAQLGRIRDISAVGDRVGHEAPVAVVFDHLGGGRGHVRVPGEGGFHLSQLDAEAAQLHLVVGAAEVVQFAAGVAAYEVAGAVHPGARRAEGVGGEAGRGQTGPVEVTTGQRRPAEPQFTGHPIGHRPQPCVQHIRAGTRQPPADGRSRALQLQRIRPRGHDRGLGRPVGVHQAVVRRPPRHQLRPTGVSPDRQGLQVGQRARRVRRQRGQRGRRQQRVRDTATAQHLRQLGTEQRAGRRHHQSRPLRQGHAQLQHRGIETRRGERQNPVPGTHLVVRGLGGGEARHPPVGDDHTLGSAGRTRGVDDVRRIIQPQRTDTVDVRGSMPRLVGRCGGEQTGDLFGAQGQRGRRVPQHQLNPLLRIAGIHRQERRTRLRDRHLSQNHLRRTRQRQRNKITGTHTPRDEPVRQHIRPRLQLRERQRQARRIQSSGIRRAIHRRLHQNRQSDRLHGINLRASRTRQQTAPLGGRQHINGIHSRGVRRTGQLVQGVQQLVGQGAGRGRLEVAGVVAELDREPLARRDHHGERIVGRLQVAFLLDGQAVPGQRVRVERVVLEDHDAVEQAGAAGDVAPGLHLGEGDEVVAPGLRLGGLELAEPVQEAPLPVDVCPSGQRVDEQADHGGHAREIGRAPGDGRAEHHVVTAAVAGLVGVEGLPPGAHRVRHHEGVVVADDRREVGHGEQGGAVRGVAQERQHVVLRRVHRDPGESGRGRVLLPEGGRGQVRVVEVPHQPPHTPVVLPGRVGVVQEPPVESLFLRPLGALGELLSHEEELLAGVGPHEGQVGAVVGAPLPPVAGHLRHQRALAVHHLVVGERQEVVLAVRVDHGEGQLAVVVLAVHGFVPDVLQGVVRPAHVPLQAEAEPAEASGPGVVGGPGDAVPGGGLLGDGDDPRGTPVDGGVHLLEEGHGVQVLAAAVLVRRPLTVLARVVEVEHGGDGVHTQAVDVELLAPVSGVGDKEVAYFLAAVVEGEGSPVGVFGTPGVVRLVEGLAVERRQRPVVLGEVGRNPVDDHPDAGLVQGVDEVFEVAACPAEPAQVVEADAGRRRAGEPVVPGQVPQGAVADAPVGDRAELLLHGLQGAAPVAVRHVERDGVQGGEPADRARQVDVVEQLVLAAVPLKADGDGPPSRPPGEDPAEGGEERVVDPGAIGAGHLAQQRVGALPVEAYGDLPDVGHGVGAVALADRVGTGVHGQRRGTVPGHVLPVLALGREATGCGVRVQAARPLLDGGGALRQTHRFPGPHLPVGGLQVLKEYAPGDAVDHQVMHRQEQAGAGPVEQAGGEERAGVEAEGGVRLGREAGLGLLGGRGVQAAQVVDFEEFGCRRPGVGARLPPRSVVLPVEARAQGVVVGPEGGERAAQGVGVDVLGRLHDEGLVEELGAVRSRVQEPVLDGCERDLPGHRVGAGDGCGSAAGGCEGGDRGMPEQVARGEGKTGGAGA
ncbi:putative Linear gramicidin synthase subunit C [Streptomyces aurantiacus JA 4570]|uniref:Putative Linear gramicidin synthase subunit C n=1 Tax=Streptomyces aurantiacus JA 4570 TaxID=1286094 RepID=S4A1R7_9ACTN|nr:putative Linear gramicidin synthase subunit C [Streptomyces aurantiacus JA 4570]